MSAPDPIAETTERQRIAADPSLSAFVSANAGSGKTRVLTNRVARLLLERADPSTILCITFTKAAAAEMEDRLFTLLGEWALFDDGDLQSALAELDGEPRIRSAGELSEARRLFARALETPGGLKIQTIHAFCESVLKRFPLEAGIAPGFTVLDEQTAETLKCDSVDHTAANAVGDVSDAFNYLLTRLSGVTLRDALIAGLSDRGLCTHVKLRGVDNLVADLRAALGVTSRPDVLIDGFLSRISEGAMRAAYDALVQSGGNPKKLCAPPIEAYFKAPSAVDKFTALAGLFLKTDGEPRGAMTTKATDAIDPAAGPLLKALQQPYIETLGRVRDAQTCDDSRAFLCVLLECFDYYEARKSAGALLDFDDLIARTGALFSADGGAAWVLYKLDAGLSHVLLDEAQDTSPDAWKVIEAPLAEFFAGKGARSLARTFFAVGDQKQSIYSFQGADAALFGEKSINLGAQISAAHPFRNITLNASFRTTAPVLAFVDALFASDEVIEGVSVDRPLTHRCTRIGDAGCVELWPLAHPKDREDTSPWDAPIDAVPPDNPARRLADAVASRISDWLTRGEELESAGRPITPGDIMILVQARGAPFKEMIGALGRRGIPTLGPDRVILSQDQGVLDLISFARAVLYPHDDLSLAETLKGPFFNFDEDALYDLAAERAERRLWDEFAKRRTERPDLAAAFDQFDAARAVAARAGAVEFFSFILETGDPSGWNRLFRRLGLPAREPVEELLRQAHDFERANPPSLRLFLDHIVNAGAEISREASEAGEAVRVMTVHKAKGLEANIVFLLDANRTPKLSSSAIVKAAIAGRDPLPVFVAEKAGETSAEIRNAREQARRQDYEEYRRLLYVAATRARERLYICGVKLKNRDPSKKDASEKSWHALAADAMASLPHDCVSADSRLGGEILRYFAPQTREPQRSVVKIASGARAETPPALLRPAEIEGSAKRISASAITDGNDASPAYSPMIRKEALDRGRIIHLLLQWLPEIAPDARRAAGERLLAHHGAAFDAAARAAMLEEALGVLRDEKFAAVYGTDGISEAPIAGRPRALGGATVFGVIDRLAVLPDRILIVDYKTNRPPPADVKDAPPGYIDQLAAYGLLLKEIYPDRQIEAALLWTYEARLAPIPPAMLEAATQRIVKAAMGG